MLLLDSNVLLRLASEAEPYPDVILTRLRAERRAGVSVATPWELWIKAASGKLKLPEAQLDVVIDYLGLEVLGINLDDARCAASLPLLHRDPFDRMIVAQALNRDATLVTSDRRLAEYGVQILLV